MLKLTVLIALIATLVGCDWGQINYTCTVTGVEGTFVSSRFHLKTRRKMVTLYRFNNEKKRTFVFPTERVQCEKD